jgi:hypothetical protein
LGLLVGCGYRFLQVEQMVWLMQFGFSILEVAVDPSYAFFFQQTWQKRLI